MSSGAKYDLVAQYDGLEGLSRDETRVLNMFRYYEEEDTRSLINFT